jgi:hypothetical protein
MDCLNLHAADMAHEPSTARPAKSTINLRAWFLSNLANPYPSLKEKRQWAESMGTTVRSLDSLLTNWRRRAGWGDIKRKWGGDNKAGMFALIQAYNSGHEKRPEVCAAILTMRAYFEDTPAGDWVDEVRSLKQQLLTIVTHITSSSGSSEDWSQSKLQALSLQLFI